MDAARSKAWANPSSIHAAGQASRALLEQARERIARAVSAHAADIVLTSGGTEACNLAVLGPLARGGVAHVVTTAIEHPTVSAPIRELETVHGVRVTRLSVPAGRPPDAAALARELTGDTRLVAIQWVNHETGTLLPVAAYASACRTAGVLCAVDATQALGKLPVDVAELGADLLAFASHKLGGPAGAGALWVRRGLDIDPRILGGGQERGRRAGTPDVLAQVGFGAACELVSERLAAQPRLAKLRARMEAALCELGAVVNAGEAARVATATNVSLRAWRGEALVAALDLEGVAASSGAACSSGKSEPSAVLLSMYPDEPWRAQAALRLSLGVETTESEVEFALTALRKVLARPPA